MSPSWSLLPALGIALVGTAALARVGYSWSIASLLSATILLGGRLDVLMLGRGSGPGRTPIGLNLGGAVLPIGIAVERSASLPEAARAPLAAAIAVVGVLSLGLARVERGRGIVLAWPLTGLLAGALALILNPVPGRSPTFAFIAGLFGPLLGAELPRLPTLARLRARRAVIGGGGGFDGLVWSAWLAALLGSPA